ncbi:MAG TPA: archaeal heat shock protein Hsp20 [Candidatus Thermoplasmatota archaeon]|nr:archaeal heat shock protein Hsp20 [Candidatus Thermoplasmatota archaeon]
MPSPKTPPTPPTAPDPWANFPGGNPFGAGGPFGGDPFAGMDAWLRSMGMDAGEFRKLVDEMQRNMQEALKDLGSDPSKSFVGGFSVKLGPDGKPTVNTFGNKPTVKAPAGAGVPTIATDEREPLTDVIDDGKRIAVTMEIPGVAREDIDLNMTETELEISVDNEKRKYHKRVRLPAKVDPATTKATYTNGILDVTVQKTNPSTGVRIAVE